MGKKQIKILSYGLIASVVLGCDAPQSIKEDNSSKQKVEVSGFSKIEEQKISKELQSSIVDYIYTVNGIKYGVDSLPSLYTKINGKKRKLFIEKYLNYTLSLEALKKEQEEYKKEIEKHIKEAFDKNNHRGIVLDELEKEILIKSITLRTIAREEMAKERIDLERIDLDKIVKEFYVKNEKKYHYNRNIEVSYIYFKSEKKAKDVLAKLTEKKVDIKRFASFAKEYSISKKMKFNGGYFGFLLEDEKHKAFFSKLWESKNNGFINKILKSNEFFILAYVHQKREKGIESFEEARDKIRTAILTKRVGVWINRHYRKIMEHTKVDIFDSFEDNKSF
jgi:hypothetical protein